ncbi:MAG: hypothetical protein F4093_11570 [Gammaproteobacteria bacterium]|nr:hypothetical protein [Gammaproteobacteria bacterium]
MFNGFVHDMMIIGYFHQGCTNDRVAGSLRRFLNDSRNMSFAISHRQQKEFHQHGVTSVDDLITASEAEELRDRAERLFRGELGIGIMSDEVNWQEEFHAPNDHRLPMRKRALALGIHPDWSITARSAIERTA